MIKRYIIYYLVSILFSLFIVFISDNYEGVFWLSCIISFLVVGLLDLFPQIEKRDI